MAEKFDPTNPAHFALFSETDAKLAHRGYSQEQIAELRKVQQSLPPVTSSDELAGASKAQARAWGDAEPAQKPAAASKPAEAK